MLLVSVDDMDEDSRATITRLLREKSTCAPRVHEYLVHYHEGRNHQGLSGQLILPPAKLNQPGPIVCRERRGGLLRFYHSKAA